MRDLPRFATLACGALLLVAGCPSRPATAVSALELHRRAIVIDTHSDCTQRVAYDGIDFARAQPDMHVDLPKMRAGGLDAEFFSIFVGPWRTKPEGYYAEAMKQFDAVHAMIQAHPETIAWARTAADVRANAEHKRISALFGVEGGHALLPGGETEMLEHLRTFYARGARYLTLTWSIASPLGGSSGDDSDGQGLTDVGRRIIDEMERLGMMIDVSHVSDPLFWDVVRYARKPVIASHSSARELANVAGIDHVCLGSDFDGIPATPVGLEDASKLPALTAELVRRGYAPGDIEKILGGNVLRVLAANEPAAGSRR